MKIHFLFLLAVLSVFIISGCITGNLIPENKTVPFSKPFKISTFSIRNNPICKEDGKPVIRMYSTTWYPENDWIGEIFENVVNEYIQEGKIVAYHWQIDTGDNTLTEEIEENVPDSEIDILKQFDPDMSIPAFIFGCKYYRIGTRYKSEENGAEKEAQEFRNVIDEILNEGAE